MRSPALDARRTAVESELDALLLELPNVTLADVPEGGEEYNVIIRTWGEPRAVDAAIKPHWDVGESLGMFDLARGAKVSGSGFVVHRGQGARLIRALMNYFVDTHTSTGYEEIWAPALVTRATMIGTGQLPKFEDDAYAIRGDDLFLIPTGRGPGHEPLSRRDPRSVGAADGLRRVHAVLSPARRDRRGRTRVASSGFTSSTRSSWFATPPQTTRRRSSRALTGHAEALLQALGLAYRVKLLAAGDTGFSSAKTYDLEVFAPGVGAWLEVSSCSVFTDFQARRANIRYRPAPGEKPRFVHTLNGSGLAFPRIIAAAPRETISGADGTVSLPAPLHRYFGDERVAAFRGPLGTDAPTRARGPRRDRRRRSARLVRHVHPARRAHASP